MSVLFTNVNVWFDYVLFCNTLHLSDLKQQVIINIFCNSDNQEFRETLEG